MMRNTSTFIAMLFTALTVVSAFHAPVVAQDAAAAAAPVPAAVLDDIPQVQIQVWISETNEQGMRKIGNNLNYTRVIRGVERETGSLRSVTTNVFDPVNDFGPVTIPTPPIGAGSDILPTDAREGVGMEYTILSTDYGTIDGVFRSVEHQSDVDLISKPEILVVDGGVATIKAGGQVPYQSVAFNPKNGTPALAMAWKDVGVNLKIQPKILGDDIIQLHMQQLDVTDLIRIERLRGVDLPVFSTRSQTGFVNVPNGQTVVIGGLTSRAVRRAERRIPIVGKIPILGMPFRGRKSEADIINLLIFVSPTKVNLHDLSDNVSYSAMNFWKERGKEWENADRIEKEIEALDANS